jgi:Flp pilus assembly protein TadG
VNWRGTAVAFNGEIKSVRSRFSPKRFLKANSGATAVEFAMVAPVFFMALGSVVEMGLMLFTEYVLQSSVQEAARQIRTGQAQSAGLSSAQFKTEICDLAKVVMKCEANVHVYVRSAATFTALKAATPSYLTVGTAYGGATPSTSYSCGGPSQAVAIIATYDWDIVLPFMDAFGNIDGGNKRRIAGFAMFQNEPFPTGTSCS